MLVEMAATLAAGGAGAIAWAGRGRASSAFGPSVWRGNRERRAVALTFDDGPSESTPELLDVLDRHGARATFFLTGANVRRLPAVAREIARRGHQIGNHSDDHRLWCLRSPGFVRCQLEAAQRIIVEATGAVPVVFRAPYGARWFGMRRAQAELGLTGVMWTAIGRDWALPAGRVVERLLAAACNGAIFCLHDGRTTVARPDVRATIEAVDRLVPELKRRGFHFETVSEILQPAAPRDAR
jgi:peptidoglycan/xylan/chitin deacetylase (PgdA/CDA1 family)